MILEYLQIKIDIKYYSVINIVIPISVIFRHFIKIIFFKFGIWEIEFNPLFDILLQLDRSKYVSLFKLL